MMKQFLAHSLVVLMLLTASMAVPVFATKAYAQTTDPDSTGTPSDSVINTTDASGDTITCDDIPEAKNGTLIGKIVPCMTYTIEQSTVRFAQRFVAALMPVFYAFVVLVIAFYAVRMLMGEPELHKQGMLMLLKIAIIAILLNDLGNVGTFRNDDSGAHGEIIPIVYGLMEEAQTVAIGAITTTNLKCDLSKYGGDDTPRVWAMMDCISGKLFGYVGGTQTNAAGGKSTNMLLVASFFGLMTGFFFGGVWGVVIFLGMLGVLFAVFRLVIGTVVSFLSSYLVVCVLLIISPLFIPLALLRITNQYFESYWRLILASMLTPMLITCYTTFAIIVYDKMLFADDSILNTLLQQANVTPAMAADRKPCTYRITGKPEEMRTPSAGTIIDVLSSPMQKTSGLQTTNGSNDPCANFSIPNLLLDKIKHLPSKATDAGQVAKGKFERETFYELLQLFLLAYLMNAGLTTWTTMITQIVGKGSALRFGQTVFAQNPQFMNGATDAVRAAKNRFLTTDKNGNTIAQSGSEFLGGIGRNVPGAIKDSLAAFAKTTSRKP